MNEWSQRTQNHAVHQALVTTLTVLEQALSKPEIAPDAVASLDRVNEVLRRAQRGLSSVDPVFVPPATLNNIHSSVEAIRTELNNFSSNQNTAHLRNANTHADTILLQLSDLRPPETIQDVEGMRTSIGEFRDTVAGYLAELSSSQAAVRASLTDLRNRVDETTREVSSQKARLDTAISQFQQQFSDSEQKRREEFTAAETTRLQTFQDQQKQFTQTINDAVADLKRNFAALLDDHKKRLDDFFTDSEARSTALREKLQSRADETALELTNRSAQVLAALDDHKKRAEDLVAVITNTGNVAGYQRIANQHRRARRFWQGVAVVAMVGLIGFAIVAAQATLQQTVNWATFSARVFVSLAFGILGAYAAREADKHDDGERLNRRLELELASIHPFMVGLPEQMQHDIKRELANKLFGQDLVGQRQKPDASGSAYDLLRLALETISNITKKQ